MIAESNGNPAFNIKKTQSASNPINIINRANISNNYSSSCAVNVQIISISDYSEKLNENQSILGNSNLTLHWNTDLWLPGYYFIQIQLGENVIYSNLLIHE